MSISTERQRNILNIQASPAWTIGCIEGAIRCYDDKEYTGEEVIQRIKEILEEQEAVRKRLDNVEAT